MTDPTVTAFVGDSLTEQGDWQAWLPGQTVRNFGISGTTSDDLIGRLDDVIAARPGTVVLLIGTNDFAWRQPVERIIANIETILNRLHAELPEARILVQSIPPRSSEYAHLIRDVNAHLRSFAPTVGARFLDLWPALADEAGGLRPEFCRDELHLNAEGYAAWLDVLKPALTD